MNRSARVLFALSIVFVLCAFVLFGYQTTASACALVAWSWSYLLVWMAFAASMGLLILGFNRARGATLPAVVLVASVLLCLALLGQRAARCVPPDARAREEVRSLQAGLSQYHDQHGSYPDTLARVTSLPIVSPGLHYETTDNSYRICMNFRKSYFYGLLLSGGSPSCYGPDSKVSP